MNAHAKVRERKYGEQRTGNTGDVREQRQEWKGEREMIWNKEIPGCTE